MSKIYGYCRCSTTEERQDINRQKRELYKLGVEDEKNIYWEYESGTKNDRAEFNKLLDLLEKGDTLCTTEVSRLTRSTSYLCDILKIVQEKHIRLMIGNFVVDCREDNIDPMTKGMLMMWGVFAEMERDMISARVKSGMANAKAKGKKIGRPKVDKTNLEAFLIFVFGLVIPLCRHFMKFSLFFGNPFIRRNESMLDSVSSAKEPSISILVSKELSKKDDTIS